MFFSVLLIAIRAQSIPHRTGQESLVGRTGKVRGKLSPRGVVQIGGEQWTAELAEDEEPLGETTRVEVVEVRGLKLIVRKAGSRQATPKESDLDVR